MPERCYFSKQETRKKMLKLLLLTTVLLGIAIAGIAIKMFVFKNGVFTKSCSSHDDSAGKNGGCVCGGTDKSKCKNKNKHKEFNIKVEPYRG